MLEAFGDGRMGASSSKHKFILFFERGQTLNRFESFVAGLRGGSFYKPLV
jgi:hypothetical protein